MNIYYGEKALIVADIQQLNDIDQETYQIYRSHMIKSMRKAIKECITPTQRDYLNAYFKEGLSMEAIGARYGVNKASVSRGIKRARERIYDYVRYSSPFLLNAELSSKRLYNGNRRNKNVNKTNHV